MRTTTLTLFALIAASACSGGRGAMPTPTPTLANVAGTWQGTVSYTAGGVAARDIIDLAPRPGGRQHRGCWLVHVHPLQREHHGRNDSNDFRRHIRVQLERAGPDLHGDLR